MSKRRRLIALGVVAVALAGMAYTHAWARAGVNPLLLARGVAMLQFSGAELVAVTPKVLLQRAGTAEGPLTAYLAGRGWEFRDRLGSGIFYEKDGARLFVYARFTRGYNIYELDRVP